MLPEPLANRFQRATLVPFIPSSPMTQFHTVKEAARITGKSPSSIRRIIYPIITAESHPDRHHIRPAADEVPGLRLKGENFAWRISDELLRREVQSPGDSEKGSEKLAGHAARDASAELLVMLRGELEIKNQQIAAQSLMLSQQMQLISGLSERIREGNVLIASLQKQLSLPEGENSSTTHAVDATTQPSRAGESAAKKKSPSKATKKKRGLLDWFSLRK